MSGFNPLAGDFAPSKPRLTAGISTAVFVGATHVPVSAKAKFPSIVFRFQILDGPDVGQEVTRDVPVPQQGVTAGSAFGVWTTKVGGMTPDQKGYNLTACIGKRFKITVAERMKKDGTPSGWMHIVECVPAI